VDRQPVEHAGRVARGAGRCLLEQRLGALCRLVLVLAQAGVVAAVKEHRAEPRERLRVRGLRVERRFERPCRGRQITQARVEEARARA